MEHLGNQVVEESLAVALRLLESLVEGSPWVDDPFLVEGVVAYRDLLDEPDLDPARAKS